MTAERLHKITRQYADARQRANDARRQGDDAGYRYSIAECRRLGRILAEGS